MAEEDRGVQRWHLYPQREREREREREAGEENDCGARGKDRKSEPRVGCKSSSGTGSTHVVPLTASGRCGPRQGCGSQGSSKSSRPDNSGCDEAADEAVVETKAETSALGENYGLEMSTTVNNDNCCGSYQPTEGHEKAAHLEVNPSQEGTTDKSVPHQAVVTVTAPRECVSAPLMRQMSQLNRC